MLGKDCTRHWSEQQTATLIAIVNRTKSVFYEDLSLICVLCALMSLGEHIHRWPLRRHLRLAGPGLWFLQIRQ